LSNINSNLGGGLNVNNEERTEVLIKRYDFDFSLKYHVEIIQLLEKEIMSYQEGSSEYLRFLSGYLFCIGDVNDVEIIKKAKYSINMDVGCMIDGAWIESLENGGIESENVYSRQLLIDAFVRYYDNFEASEDSDEW
jgi:antitoxin component YwqK of YwqJK toxin-antitoxin module